MKNTIRDILVGLFITIVGGVIVARFIREGARFNTPPTSTPAILTPTLNLTTPESQNWAASSEYGFPDGFWDIGVHEYTISADCPNFRIDDPNTFTQPFIVSSDAQLFPGEVTLRVTGLKNLSDGGTVLDTIHPSQKTAARVTVGSDLSQNQAEFALGDCKATISWDDGPLQTMTPYLEQR